MNDYDASSREQWGSAAAGWSRAAEEPDSGASADVARWLLEYADLRPGERVLEIACGAGRVGLQAAEQVGPEGFVLCTDFAEAMVDVVRQRIEGLGVGNAEARVMDAQEMEFPADERFDAALCRMGYMLMADPAAALRRTHDALKPGGRAALGVWGAGEANPWLALIFKAVMEHLNAPPPEPGTPGPFALADEEHVRSLLEEAGFAEIRVERLQLRQQYDSVEDWWETVLELGGALANLLGALSEEDRAAIRGRAFDLGREEAETGEGISFPATVVAAGARRPAEG